jgi:hypothetical protein
MHNGSGANVTAWLPNQQLCTSYFCLQVASEDTVLFTTQAYVDALAGSVRRRAAKKQLAPLIRCPHLSGFWLSALALSDDARLLLIEQQEKVGKLLMMLHAHPSFKLTAAELDELLPGPPSSWVLPARVDRPVSSMQLTWRVDVDTLRAHWDLRHKVWDQTIS